MMTGHRCKKTVCGFAEKVHFKVTTDKNRKNKMDTEWDVGFYLGTNPRTAEYLVHNEAGVISCSTIRRMQDDKAYDDKCVEAINRSYRDYVCEGSSSTNPRVRMATHMPSRPDPAPITAPIIPRRMRINPSDLMKFGYTVGCPGCEALQSGHRERRNHIEACRARIEEQVANTDRGKERLGKAKDRLDQWTHDQTAANVIPEPVETPNTGGASGSADAEMMQDTGEEPVGMVIEEEDDRVQLEDADNRGTEARFRTPDRPVAVKRFQMTTPEGMEVQGKNTRPWPRKEILMECRL